MNRGSPWGDGRWSGRLGRCWLIAASCCCLMPCGMLKPVSTVGQQWCGTVESAFGSVRHCSFPGDTGFGPSLSLASQHAALAACHLAARSLSGRCLAEPGRSRPAFWSPPGCLLCPETCKLAVPVAPLRRKDLPLPTCPLRGIVPWSPRKSRLPWNPCYQCNRRFLCWHWPRACSLSPVSAVRLTGSFNLRLAGLDSAE